MGIVSVNLSKLSTVLSFLIPEFQKCCFHTVLSDWSSDVCSSDLVVSDSVRPQRWQPTRLPRPWDSPGKNTGVGCHFLLQCKKVKSASEVTQSCPTLRDPMDCSLPGSSVHGIFQARVLEWGAIAFSTSPHTYIIKPLKCLNILILLTTSNRILGNENLFSRK